MEVQAFEKWSIIIIRFLIIAAFAIAVGLFFLKLFSKKQDHDIIDRDAIDIDNKPRNASLIPIILLVVAFCGVVFFILPRFGISLMGLFQKVMAFLPLVRGFLPF